MPWASEQESYCILEDYKKSEEIGQGRIANDVDSSH
jgi:hypothetical protein